MEYKDQIHKYPIKGYISSYGSIAKETYYNIIIVMIIQVDIISVV